MRNLGIKTKIWFSIAIFAVGYVALLVLLQWTASENQTHMKLASGSLFSGGSECARSRSCVSEGKQGL